VPPLLQPLLTVEQVCPPLLATLFALARRFLDAERAAEERRRLGALLLELLVGLLLGREVRPC